MLSGLHRPHAMARKGRAACVQVSLYVVVGIKVVQGAGGSSGQESASLARGEQGANGSSAKPAPAVTRARSRHRVVLRGKAMRCSRRASGAIPGTGSFLDGADGPPTRDRGQDAVHVQMDTRCSGAAATRSPAMMYTGRLGWSPKLETGSGSPPIFDLRNILTRPVALHDARHFVLFPPLVSSL